MKNKIPLAKPTGITLPDHTAHVVTVLFNYLTTQTFFIKKLQKLFPEINITEELIKSCILHDEGKKALPWQTPCQKDFELFIKGLTLHHIMTANYRHEFKSVLAYFDNLSDDQFIAIMAHHGKLRLIKKNIEHILKVEEITDIKKSVLLKRLYQVNDKLSKMSDAERTKWIYRLNLQRAVLQFCDRKASYLEVVENEIYRDLLKFNGFSYSFPLIWKKRKIQELAENNWKDYDLLIIKARTGGGKTDAALLWGKQQIEAGYADRMIITMPTIFTTNAIENSITTETGTECRSYNSSTKNLKNDIEDKLERDYFSFDLYQRRTFQYPLISCTIDTLLNSICQKSEDAHAASFNIYNSCVVIDEFDFYDDLVMANIKILIKYLHAMGVKVLLMSATFPSSFRNFFLDIAPDFKVSSLIIDDTYDYKKRYKISCIERYDVEHPDSISRKIQRKIEKSKKTIIFCNTQKSCLRTYFYFNTLYPNQVLVYNSYHISGDKQKKESEILNDIGKKPINDKYKIIIMSQIGELSLNITCEYMVSEICPIDRLVQRLGRIGRFDDPNNPFVRNVDILIPIKNGHDYPAPYGELIPRIGWIETDKLTRTKELLTTGIYTNDKFQKIIELVYNKGVELDGDVRNNIREYETLIRTNVIMLPTEEMNDDEMNENNTTQWQRRRFLPKLNLYLTPFENTELSHTDFNYAATRNVVEIYVYQMEQLSEAGYIAEQDIVIKDNFNDRPMTIFYLNNPIIYAYETGLNLLMVEN